MDPSSSVGGFFQKWGWIILLGGGVFLASYLILGRKNNPAASTASGAQAIDPTTGLPANGSPLVEYIPTTGDSYTNIDYNSGNSMVDSHNSSSTTANNVVPPPPTPPPVTTPPNPPPVSRTPVPPVGGVCPTGMHVASDGLCHADYSTTPSGGNTPFLPTNGVCPTGWHVASDGLCHVIATGAPTPPPGPTPVPVQPPTPTQTAAQKAIADWQTANGKTWTGPAGSFPYGWGPNPYGPGAGVVNNGVFSYVVQP